jgi:hypothetical protein
VQYYTVQRARAAAAEPLTAVVHAAPARGGRGGETRAAQQAQGARGAGVHVAPAHTGHRHDAGPHGPRHPFVRAARRLQAATGAKP